jgi:hypothetical protein
MPQRAVAIRALGWRLGVELRGTQLLRFNLFVDEHHGRHWTVAATDGPTAPLLC